MELASERLRIDAARVDHELKTFIQTSVGKLNGRGVVVGLSGGIDSSVVLTLAVSALGSPKVLGLIMPDKESSQNSESYARLLAVALGVRVERVELTPILDEIGIYRHIPRVVFAQKRIAGAVIWGGYKAYATLTGARPFLSGLEGPNSGFLKRADAYYRMKHRQKMVILYAYAERANLLVVGAANKTELLTGFFVKYGDSAADIMPLLQLYKTQVRQLAEFLHIPERILDKAPNPDLKPGITDESAMGIPYEKLDLILSGLDMSMAGKEIAIKTGVKQATIEYVKEMVRRSEHMRASPLVPN